MPRESKQAKLNRALLVNQRMQTQYPQAASELNSTDSFSFLIAVILSAQTSDAAVNQVTPALFNRWPDAFSLADADPNDVAETIRRIGFFKVKAKHCIATAQMIVSDYAGQVPQTLAELMRLPGVGRKTANVVLAQSFGVSEGIAVDTHVFRIAHRLGFVAPGANTPNKVEQELLRLYPSALWGEINRHWVLFGREFCIARQPHCMLCPLADICPSAVK